MPAPQPSRPLSADVALSTMEPETITVSPEAYAQLTAALEEPARPLPKLAQLLAEAPRWA